MIEKGRMIDERFENVLGRAMEEDEEVLKAIWKFYRGTFDKIVPRNEFGERYVLFDFPAYRFEEIIRSEIDCFVDGLRVMPMAIYPCDTVVIVPEGLMEDSNYSYRTTDFVCENYINLHWNVFYGDTMVPKKDLEKILRKRGWL